MANITDQSHTLTGVFTRRRSPEPLGNNRPMTTAVAPNTYAGHSVKMTAGLAWTYHTPAHKNHSPSEGLANCKTTRGPNTLPHPVS